MSTNPESQEPVDHNRRIDPPEEQASYITGFPPPFQAQKVATEGFPMPPPAPHFQREPFEFPTLTEEFVGRRILPVVGSMLLLGALAYWAPIAYNHLQPGVAFVIELLSSLSFLALGRVFKNAKYYFGEVLSGLGAGGLLVTLMAGSQYQHLYSGSVMVSLTLGTSIAMGIYGAVEQSKNFQAISAIGGLISAWLPCNQNDYLTSLVLQTVVISATVAMFAQSRWKPGLIVLWIASSSIMCDVLTHGQLDWRWRVALLDLIGLEFSLAYASIGGDLRFDPKSIFAAVPVGVSIFGSMLIHGGQLGSAHLIIYSAFIMATAFLFQVDLRKRDIFGWWSLFTLGILVPTGLQMHLATFWVATLACALSMLAICRNSKKLATAALAESLIGFALFVGSPQTFFTQWTFSAALLLVSFFGCMLKFYREPLFRNESIVAFCGLGAVLLECVAFSSGVPFGSTVASTGVLAVWGLILLTSGYAFESKPARICGYISLTTCVAKLTLYDLVDLKSEIRAALLLITGLILLLGGYIAVRGKTYTQEPA